MEKRQIRMQDGRYLIFYTFAQRDAATAPPHKTEAAENLKNAASEGEPVAKPEAEEERSV